MLVFEQQFAPNYITYYISTVKVSKLSIAL